MKSLFMIVVVLVLAANAAYAGFSNDLAAANALYSGKQFEAAQRAYEKMLVDYPNVGERKLVGVYLSLGDALKKQERYAAAQIIFEKVIADYPEVWAHHLAAAYFGLGDSLRWQNRGAEAQVAYVKAGTLVFVRLSWQKKVMNRINPAILGKEQYKAYLQKVLLLVPAKTDEDAKFLGFIQSELGKLK